MKKNLTGKFAEWLTTYSSIELMHNYDFAEYEINRLLKSEAQGDIIAEDKNTFTAMYEYTFSILPKYSTDNKPHCFCFDAKVIGIKGNVTANDYEFEDLTELEFTIK